MQRPGTLAAGSRGSASLSSTFPKHRRIRRRGEFGTVFEGGTRLHGRFFTFLVLPTQLSRSRLGIVASRKFGGAVQRNRAKRLIREMFRQLGPEASSETIDLVVIPRRELLTAEFTQIVKDFGSIWRRAVDRMAAHRRG